MGHGSGTAKAECRSAPCRIDAADCRMQEQRNKREEVVPGKRRVRENLLLLAKANLFLNCIAHFPPPAARDGKPSQVQCCIRPQTAREKNPGGQRKSPAIRLSFFFGIRQRPTLPGVSHRALFLRGTRTVASLGRSLRFPTLRLPVSATGGGRLRSHRARMGKT